MMPVTAKTRQLLERLIAFPTVSRDSNLALIEFLRAELADAGIESRLVPSATGDKANLYAVIGPAEVPGVMLSGHSDVVPVEGQAWSSDPFTLVEKDGHFIGRGTADMKGFIAAAVACAQQATRRPLKRPLHLAFSYDEEVGCLGVRRLIEMLQGLAVRPAFCIIGEPTSLGVAIGHKGKLFARATCHGRECHSSLAPEGLNAIHLAAELVTAMAGLQAELTAGARDEAYDVPFSTLHVGLIRGGEALNIVPNRATLDFEIRHLPEDPPEALMARLAAIGEAIAAKHRDRFPEARIDFEETNSYPALATPADAEVVAFVKSLTGANSHRKIAFGTEGGLFQQRLGLPTVVCGPGSIQQAHKPDEWLAVEQLAQCEAMLGRLVERLCE